MSEPQWSTNPTEHELQVIRLATTQAAYLRRLEFTGRPGKRGKYCPVCGAGESSTIDLGGTKGPDRGHEIGCGLRGTLDEAERLGVMPPKAVEQARR